MSKINVLVTDGRKLMREGISLLLQAPDLRVVGEAADVSAAMKLIAPLGVQVVLVMAGAAAHGEVASIQKITETFPDVRVIVLTWNASARAIRDYRDAGAVGCLAKECSSQELVAAIRAVAAGKVYLSPQLTEALVEGAVTPNRRSPSRHRAPREREILRRIASGETTKSIAHDLQVSGKTIETHRRRIMEKLNLHSVAQLTQYAVMEGLILLPGAGRVRP